ncbi:sterol desaturase family protein [Chamaesiphon polymorphus]|uniref:Sterol desaturase family protein n=1 Tax=Chamaesiphon polymorphus CCALA 037 TaxID=2107692 RepID=A0A2T1GJN8_9CYAN|nr:sterol desaturase family protein [Chamaesiphon polymorphus]PSB58024.1 sterol desaturase family protein [Chamaesiphon polymorphus CCALA 037]
MQQYLPSLALEIFSLCTWLVIIAIVFIPLERLCAQQKQPVLRKEFFIDLGYYFLNSLLPKLLLIIPMSIVAAAVHQIEPSGIYTWVAALPLRVRFVLAIIVGEFGAYWGHRWSHEIPWLWRFHAIHHSSEEIDWLVNTRAHPLDMFFGRFTGLVPIYLLGLAQPTADSADIVPLLYSVVGTVWSFWVHANMNWRFGFIERLLATPAFHHWHHTNDGAEYINKNYAAILPIIDILFGSFYLPKHRWPQKYGIEMPIEPSLTGQLLQPLKW